MKPQSLALVEYLNQGGEVTRDSAWSDFGIQNLTARLSELTAAGYDIIKSSYKQRHGPHSVRVKVTVWKFRHTITPGAHVEVVQDIGSLIPLRGRQGVVEKVDLHKALATIHIDGAGYRSLRFNALKRLPYLAPGTRVSIKPAPYVVLEYHPGVKSYTLTSGNPEHTIVVHENLVEANVQTR